MIFLYMGLLYTMGNFWKKKISNIVRNLSYKAQMRQWEEILALTDPRQAALREYKLERLARGPDLDDTVIKHLVNFLLTHQGEGPCGTLSLNGDLANHLIRHPKLSDADRALIITTRGHQTPEEFVFAYIDLGPESLKALWEVCWNKTLPMDTLGPDTHLATIIPGILHKAATARLPGLDNWLIRLAKGWDNENTIRSLASWTPSEIALLDPQLVKDLARPVLSHGTKSGRESAINVLGKLASPKTILASLPGHQAQVSSVPESSKGSVKY